MPLKNHTSVLDYLRKDLPGFIGFDFDQENVVQLFLYPQGYEEGLRYYEVPAKR